MDNNEKDIKIKKLKAKLINEEHRLVLMKKIRQSQTRPIQPQANNNNSNNSANNNSGNNLNNNNSNTSTNLSIQNNAAVQLKKLRQQASLAGRPLSLQKGAGGTNLSSSFSVTNNPNLSSAASLAAAAAAAAASNLTPAHAHQRPKVNTLWNPPPQQARHPTPVGIAPPHVGNLSRQPITTPPNVVQAMMGNLTGPQSLLMNQFNAAAAAAATSSSGSNNRRQAQSSAQMLMQNKRQQHQSQFHEQYEKTLLQQQQQLQSQHKVNLGFPTNVGGSKRSSSSSTGIVSPLVGNLSRQPITTPPNVVQDMRSSGLSSNQQSLLMNANNLAAAVATSRGRPLQQQPMQQQQQQQSSSSTSNFNKSQAAQILLQKRTAAKAAIQKQLEQTLMQLPPKHANLGIDFVPNANNIEFVYYVGLEACVDYLTNTKNPLNTQPLEEPFECSTCGTDFTPSWSWKRSNAVCENCVSNHVKKSIKNSQANRIKSILAKAAKQEHEIDQRIMAEAASVVSAAPTTPTTSNTSQQHSLLQPVSHSRNNINNNLSNTNNSNPLWPRINTAPLTTGNTRINNTNTNANPLAASLQPAALTSLLQMNPQLSALASLMTANNTNPTNPAPSANNNNQFAQVAALLMNQLTMNMWKR